MTGKDKTDGIEADYYRRLGVNLKTLRRAAGLSQKDVALHLGVSFQQIQKYESGDNRLPLDRMATLQRLYGVSSGDILAGLVPETTGPRRVPDFSGCDDITAAICLRLCAIKDPALRLKIGKIVDILAA